MNNFCCWIWMLILLVPACTRVQQTDRPVNLLFILTDEQRFDTSLPYGNQQIQTPNLNQFARKALVFERAYVTQPVCSPARSSILTGLYPHQTGVSTNRIPLGEEIKTLPEYLNPGYHSAYIGKWHLGRELDAWHGFDKRISTEDGYTAKDTSRFSDYHHWLKSLGYEPNQKRTRSFSRSFCAQLPYAHSKSKFMEERAIEFLSANKDQPFVLYLGFLEPHTPNDGPFNEVHPPADISLDSTYGWVSPPHLPLREQLIRNHDPAPRERETLQKQMAHYWGLVHQIDKSVGAILKHLEQMGLAENTIVVFTSEHGKMMGKYGLKPKRVMYDASARIPLMIRIPNSEWNGQTVSRPVSQIDLMPTLFELMTGDSLSDLPGQSWLSSLKRDPKPIFLEWHPNVDQLRRYPNCPDGYTEEACHMAREQKIRTIITPDGWKLAWSAREDDISQLFYLPDDPLEARNLYFEDSLADTVAYLQQLILSWQVSVQDTVGMRGKKTHTKNK
ncbi:MAG: sulfatase-like hydrolase/transferase [Bacteroidota bacterium]